jgi:hypothetical protein
LAIGQAGVLWMTVANPPTQLCLCLMLEGHVRQDTDASMLDGPVE